MKALKDKRAGIGGAVRRGLAVMSVAGALLLGLGACSDGSSDGGGSLPIVNPPVNQEDGNGNGNGNGTTTPPAAKTIEYIAVTRHPERPSYQAALANLEGVTVRVRWSDNTEEEITITAANRDDFYTDPLRMEVPYMWADRLNDFGDIIVSGAGNDTTVNATPGDHKDQFDLTYGVGLLPLPGNVEIDFATVGIRSNPSGFHFQEGEVNTAINVTRAYYNAFVGDNLFEEALAAPGMRVGNSITANGIPGGWDRVAITKLLSAFGLASGAGAANTLNTVIPWNQMVTATITAPAEFPSTNTIALTGTSRGLRNTVINRIYLSMYNFAPQTLGIPVWGVAAADRAPWTQGDSFLQNGNFDNARKTFQLYHKDSAQNAKAAIVIPGIIPAESVHITGRVDSLYEDELLDGFDGIEIMGRYRTGAMMWNNGMDRTDSNGRDINLFARPRRFGFTNMLTQEFIPIYTGYPNFELNTAVTPARVTIRNIVPQVRVEVAAGSTITTGAAGEIYYEVQNIYRVQSVKILTYPTRWTGARADLVDDYIPVQFRVPRGTTDGPGTKPINGMGTNSDMGWRTAEQNWVNFFDGSTFEVTYNNSGGTKTRSWVDFQVAFAQRENAGQVNAPGGTPGNLNTSRKAGVAPMPNQASDYRRVLFDEHTMQFEDVNWVNQYGSYKIALPNETNFALFGGARDDTMTRPHIYMQYYGQEFILELPVARLNSIRLVPRTDITAAQRTAAIPWNLDWKRELAFTAAGRPLSNGYINDVTVDSVGGDFPNHTNMIGGTWRALGYTPANSILELILSRYNVEATYRTVDRSREVPFTFGFSSRENINISGDDNIARNRQYLQMLRVEQADEGGEPTVWANITQNPGAESVEGSVIIWMQKIQTQYPETLGYTGAGVWNPGALTYILGSASPIPRRIVYSTQPSIMSTSINSVPGTSPNNPGNWPNYGNIAPSVLPAVPPAGQGKVWFFTPARVWTYSIAPRPN